MARRRRVVPPASVTEELEKKASTPNKNHAIAAATKIAGEVKLAFEDSEQAFHEFEVFTPSATLATNTSAGWRTMSFNQGHRLFWKGGVRASTKGALLFEFTPQRNSELEARGVTVVEIQHDKLDAIIGPKMTLFLTNAMGATLPELLKQALEDLTADDLDGAMRMTPDPEVKPDEKTLMPDWGAFA